jgi:hypothetical protein
MPLQYLLLEIADDGRYNLTLAIPDYPQQSWEVESVCTFPGTRATRQKTPATRPAVMLAVPSFQGTLNADRAVVGELAAPVRRGPQSMTGNWSFSRAEETP